MPPVDRSACLTKLDASGAIVWNRGYLIGERCRGMAVRKATDEPAHFVMMGHSDSLSGANHRIFLMKTDDLGNPLWSFVYGPASGRQFAPKMELRNVASGGYIGCGTVDDGLTGRLGFLLRVDNSGGLMWMRFYSQAGLAFNLIAFNDVQETTEGFVVTGNALSQFPPGPSQNSLDTIIMTVDTAGNPIWANQYANLEGNQGGEGIALMPDGYAVVGGHLPVLLDAYTTELFRVDSTGGLLWYNRMFGILDGGSHYQNQQLANGDLRSSVNGELTFVGGNFGDAGLFQFDGLGSYVNGQTYGYAYAQWGTSYVIEPSGEFTVVGPTHQGTHIDYYAVRADSNFLSGCNEAPITPVIDHPPINVVPITFIPQDVTINFGSPPIDDPLTWSEVVLCAESDCLDEPTITCELTSGDVQITWGALPGTAAFVELKRNGTLIATPSTASTGYLDTSPPFGTNVYELTVTDVDPLCDRVVVSCSKYVPITVITATATDVIFHPFDPNDDDPDDPIICWADDLQTKGRVPRVITDFADISPNLGSDFPDVTPIVWLSLGEFPNQHVLTQAEGQILADYLAGGGSLHIDGGDVAFGPPTALSSLDGVIATDDGAPGGTVPAISGLDSGAGLDASSLFGDYSGSGHSIDHLAPDGNGAGAVFQNTGGEGQITAVYYDASVAGTGTHRVLTSSTLLVGYEGDRSALLDVYLAALSPPAPPGTEFVRAECNGDGNVDLGDGIYLLSHLFSAGPEGPCHAACDANGDGGINLADAIFTFTYLLLSGSPPPAPFPGCGIDAAAEATFGCANSPNCP